MHHPPLLIHRFFSFFFFLSLLSTRPFSEVLTASKQVEQNEFAVGNRKKVVFFPLYLSSCEILLGDGAEELLEGGFGGSVEHLFTHGRVVRRPRNQQPLVAGRTPHVQAEQTAWKKKRHERIHEIFVVGDTIDTKKEKISVSYAEIRVEW